MSEESPKRRVTFADESTQPAMEQEKLGQNATPPPETPPPHESCVRSRYGRYVKPPVRLDL